MKLNWFIRRGIFFLPASILGWIIFVAAAMYAIYLFFEIDSRSHSASDTIINWVFNCFIVSVIYSVIALFTARKEEESNHK